MVGGLSMFIVSKDRDVVINMDNATNVYIENENLIMARMVDSEEIVLGRYLEHAEDVFREMLKNVFPPATLIFKNCMADFESEQWKNIKDRADLGAILVSDGTEKSEIKMYDCGVYYMPEGRA